MKKLIGLLLFTALSFSINVNSQGVVNNYAFDSTVSYDADAQAFFDINTGLTTAQKNAINDLVLGFKANGTWSKHRADYPIIGGTASTHKWNLKDPRDLDAAFRLTFSGTWTHSANGMQGDGSTAYADTHFIDSDHWTDAGSYINATIGYYSNLDVAGTTSSSTEMGREASDNTKELIIQVNDGSGMYGRIYNSSSMSRGTTGNRKWAVINALGGTAKMYENGVPQGASQTMATNSFNGEAIYINASKTGVTAIFSNRRCAYAMIADGLTDEEIAADFAVIQAYQTALGRNF